MFLIERSNFIRNHFHLNVPMEFYDIPRCINDVPKYLVLKSLNDINVALFRATPQLCAVGQYLFVQLQFIVYRQGRYLEDLIKKVDPMYVLAGSFPHPT
jgi:hypothetical protein